MLPGQHWARNFSVKESDIDNIVNLLLEKEMPLSSFQLAHILVENRLSEEVTALEKQFADAEIYSPAHSYEVGQKIVFPVMDYATAHVTGLREGNNPEYGTFSVIAVEFEEQNQVREFASGLEAPHKLSQETDDATSWNLEQISADEILEEVGDSIVASLEQHLKDKSSLIHLAGKWFPKDLMLEVNEGHLHLAEAVLDINRGGPMKTRSIIKELGGLGNSPMPLQEFSLNYALNADRRFDEVGPTGEVLWYLARMEPDGVREVPSLLRYTAIEYDRSLLTKEMKQLEAEIADELSDLPEQRDTDSGTVTLIYPHRRAGTLPLNNRVRHLFPTARNTPRVWLTLVDGQDGEEFVGWVLPKERYIYGAGPMYAKHTLPIGANITIVPSDRPDHVVVKMDTYKARSEWIPLLSARPDGFSFETSKRGIGADYDDQIILGIDDLEALDEMIKSNKKQPTLAALMRQIIPNLARLNPQGTAHVKTIYSTVNVFRRCPPGPIMAILEANPDFEYLGDHYWKLAED